MVLPAAKACEDSTAIDRTAAIVGYSSALCETFDLSRHKTGQQTMARVA
jgi:hypothetical protein